MDQSLQTPEQQAWLPKLLGYDFTNYKPGVENVATSTFSRSMYIAQFDPCNLWVEILKKAIFAESKLRAIMKQCAENPGSAGNYAVHN